MATSEFDIVFIADARFPGGTSTALVNEIRAARLANLAVGLIHVAGPVLRRPRAFHAGVRHLLAKGEVSLLDPLEPVACRLALVHHPMLFPRALARPMKIKADDCLIIAHHPAVNGAGVQEYAIAAQIAALAESTDLAARVAPVGPNVRASLAAEDVPLLEEDWHNLIDAAAWRRPFRPFVTPLVIGRHSRPDPLKWPDSREDILAAWPDRPGYKVDILGGGPFLEDLLGALPGNWNVRGFGTLDVREFLHGLDVFAYFHSVKWIEAFGYCALEALACGLPAILPKSFEPLFGEGAIYGEPADVVPLVDALAADQAEQKRQRARALAVVEQRYALHRFAERIERLFGIVPRRKYFGRAAPERVPTARRNVLMMSSNGVGLGHLTRLMAIAKQLSPEIRPVFFTLSRAARLAVERGYLVEHTAFHRYLETTPERWNPILEEELSLLLDFYAPAALVFDGNVPYAGLLAALKRFPDVRSVWIRRGFWRDDQGSILKRADRFDMVIEPGDLAAEIDQGPTAELRDAAIAVEPVLLTSPAERLSRAQARATLGIPKGVSAVALQLGSGSNFDFSSARARVIERLLATPDVEIIELLSPIAESSEPLQPASDRHRHLSLYPAYEISRAFDAAIVAAGYNSFHENLVGAVPTLFVANMAGEMDRQDLRARFAAQKGMALSAVGLSHEQLDRQVDRLLDPASQHSIRLALSGLPAPAGATQAARLIEEVVFAARLS